jgi:sarcosine oxidase subunit gamma
MVDRRGTPPLPANTHTESAIWLGPDEWLALDSEEGVDVCDQRAAIDVTGPDARERVARGCTLDLRPKAFPPGAAAQTLVAQTPAIILAHEHGLRLLVPSSYAGHIRGWLQATR